MIPGPVKVAPRVLSDLGAEIIPIGWSPNGRNINLRCGSMAPELLQLTVSGVQADVGIALDGDGDRLVMVDHLGRLVDGDRLPMYDSFLALARRGVQALYRMVASVSSVSGVPSSSASTKK